VAHVTRTRTAYDGVSRLKPMDWYRLVQMLVQT
jgi:hypothetical protein